MEKINEAKINVKDFNKEDEVEKEDEESTAKIINKLEELQKLQDREEEYEEEPDYISWLWYISAVLLIFADLFEIVIGFLGVISGGILSILGFLPMLFEIPGGLIFLYLINYYYKKGDLPPIEAGAYAGLVLIEFFGFLPFVGSLVEILPLKTISMLGSRTRLWRIKRLKTLKKRVKEGEQAL